MIALAITACDPAADASSPASEVEVAITDEVVLADEAAAAFEAEAPPYAAASEVPPEDPTAIGAWLRGGGYRQWIAQGPVHRASEHGGARVLFNPRLAASFAAGAAVHEPGAAAVRELYEADLATPRGFALMVKTGAGWYWYEVFGVDADATPTVAQIAAPGCVGCHAGGVDQVMPPEA